MAQKIIVFSVLLGVIACSTMEERLPEWRKTKPASETESENLSSDEELDSVDLRGEFEFKSKVLSKLPPVEFDWPLRDSTPTEFFGWRKKRMHWGIDLRASTGTKVYAAAEGEVIFASRRIRNYGKLILIDHGEGWSSLYAHLSQMNVKVGDSVESGELIGFSGRTGRVSGPHLHFEIRRGADPVDPMLFLPKIQK